jgi:N-sulfoglucosamine sulfohydrolase
MYKKMQLLILLITVVLISCDNRTANLQPNILWITCEDLSPILGCYGDRVANTPNIDLFAQNAVRFTNAYASAPICTPARSSLITGVYASSMGTHHLRGVVPKSDKIKCFTEFLRERGYYCTNNVKEDYNFITPEEAWDESSDSAHWRNRKPEQPFFSVFNFMVTHQSQTRYGIEKLNEINSTLDEKDRINPDDVEIPPYYPDTPIVRNNIASLYTQVHIMDKKFQEIINQLEEDGLRENTIIFFYSDHGTGLPRGKGYLHDTGIKVPLIIEFPEKYKHYSPAKAGAFSDELVNFIDFPPTVLSLTGIDPPKHMQGKPFLGQYKKDSNDYVVSIRDRRDEVLMFSRSIRTDKYHYIRNFLPHRPRMQRNFYSEITPIRQELRRLDNLGLLQSNEDWLMEDSVPVDELYDTETDPHELNNLAQEAEHLEIMELLKRNLFSWMVETKDLGLVPEYEMIEKSKGGAPYDTFSGNFDPKPILDLVDKIGRGKQHIDSFNFALQSSNPVYRYWGATGLAALGQNAVESKELLQSTLNDPVPYVRFAASEAICNIGYPRKGVEILSKGLDSESVVNQLHASQILMAVGKNAAFALPKMKIAIDKLYKIGADESQSYDKHRAWYTRENLEYLVSYLNGKENASSN